MQSEPIRSSLIEAQEAEPIEPSLIEALQPIRYFCLSTALFHFFESGVYDFLDRSGPLSAAELADKGNFEPDRLEMFLKYLHNENVLSAHQHAYSVTQHTRTLARYRPWYTLLIGGYSGTFMQMGQALRKGADAAQRDTTFVGIGSCGISQYDAIPLTHSLMQKAPIKLRRLLDMGCGNGLYLLEFCKAMPEVEAWGVEPHRGSYEAAQELIRENGLEHRIRLSCASATQFLSGPIDDRYQPDFAVLGFVLHEILGQDGREGVVNFLTGLVERFPEIHLIVIEVDLRIDDPRVMRHGLALAYYNPYYLLHPFTRQKLESCRFWEEIFQECGLELLATETVDARVDSTGLEVGYLLRRRR